MTAVCQQEKINFVLVQILSLKNERRKPKPFRQDCSNPDPIAIQKDCKSTGIG
jgi:hypothetical protein